MVKKFWLRPGEFDYSGFGWGDYRSIDGSLVWTTVDQAWNMAKAEGVEFVKIDRDMWMDGVMVKHRILKMEAAT